MGKIMDRENASGVTLMRVLPLLLAASLLLAPIAGAQLGEIAGQLNFQVQIGHNETLQLHLLNEGNTSIGVQVTAQTMQFTSNKTTQANQITPTIYISPENVTVPAYGTAAVNVTIFMPLSNRPNWASWQDIISAQEETNATNSGGALILQGVAKLVAVSAVPSTTTTTTIPTTIAQSGLSALSGVAVPIIILIIIIVVAIAYYYSSRGTKKRPAGRKAKKEEEMEEEEEPESKESITREIERLKKQKAKLQAEVGAAQRGRKGAARKRAPRARARRRTTTAARKRGARPRARAGTRRRRRR
jgi:hypothetical protein